MKKNDKEFILITNNNGKLNSSKIDFEQKLKDIKNNLTKPKEINNKNNNKEEKNNINNIIKDINDLNDNTITKKLIENNNNNFLNNSLNNSDMNTSLDKTNSIISSNKLNKLDINSEYIFFNKNETIFINQTTQKSLKTNFDSMKKDYDKINEQILRDFQILNLKSFKELNKYCNLNLKDPKNNIFSIIKTIQAKLKNEIRLCDIKFLDNQEYIFNLNLIKFYEITDFILLCLTVLIENKKIFKSNNLIELIEKKIKFNEIFLKFPNYHQINPNLNNLNINLLSYCIQLLEKTTEINFNIGSNDKIDENYNDKNFFYRLFILKLFFTNIFPNALKFRIDLNIYEIINNDYSLEGNQKLYQMNINEYLYNNEKNYKIFIANYVFIDIINKIGISNDALFLNIQHYDDYIIELFDCYKNELNNNINIEPKFINLRYFNCYFNLQNLFDLNIKINCLDNCLFKNYLFCLYNFSDKNILQKIKIDIFPEEIYKLNFRKMIMNKIYHQNLMTNYNKDFNENYYNWNRHDYFRWKNNKNNISSVDDSSIFDYLYDDYNENLLSLILILEEKFEGISIDIILNLPQFLLNKKCFVYSSAYFLYNLFLFITRKNSLNLNNLLIESNIEVSKYFNNLKKINLNECNIQNLSLKINNSSTFLNFNNLPFEKLTSLEFHRLSNLDFSFVRAGLINNKLFITNLKSLIIKINYEYETDFKGIYEFFENCLVKSLNTVEFYLYNSFIEDEYSILIETIINKFCLNNNLGKKISFIFECFSDDLNTFKWNKFYLKLKNILSNDNLNKEFIIFYDINLKKTKDEKDSNSECFFKINIFRYKKTKKYFILKKFFKKHCKNNINNLIFGYLMSNLSFPLTKMELEFHLKQ